MKTIDTATERKLYQLTGILHVMATVKPEGNAEQLVNLVEHLTDAAEGAAVILDDVAFAITSAMEK